MSQAGTAADRQVGSAGSSERAARVSYDRVAAAYASQIGPIAADDVEMGMTFDALVMRGSRSSDGPPVIADIGCGPGWWTRRMRGAGARSVGIDVSAAMASLAAQEGLAEFVVGGALALPFAVGALDGISFWYVLHHLDDAEVRTALSEARRVCRRGGELLIGGHVGEERRVKHHGYGADIEVLVVKRSPAWWERVVGESGFQIQMRTQVVDQEGQHHVVTARAR